MVLTVQLHAPAALPPAKEHPVSTGKKSEWGQRRFWALGQQTTLFPLRVEKRTLEERGTNVTALLCVTLYLQVSQWKIWLRQERRREFIWSSTDWVDHQILRRLKVF